jgi:hypothetical protein
MQGAPTNLAANVVETTSIDITWAASAPMTNSVKEYLDLCKDGTVVTQP